VEKGQHGPGAAPGEALELPVVGCGGCEQAHEAFHFSAVAAQGLVLGQEVQRLGPNLGQAELLTDGQGGAPGGRIGITTWRPGGSIAEQLQFERRTRKS
jgi:hypothetical protein